jgi:predicted transcriptional regulator
MRSGRVRRAEMAASLTDEQIERLHLEYALSGKVRQVARTLNIAPSTVTRHLRKPDPVALQEARTQKKVEIAERFGDLQVALIDALMDKSKIEKASYQELANTLGIATEKRLLVMGQATVRTETLTADPADKLTPDERMLAAQLREKLMSDGA